jgi:hypothetical protein
MKGELVNQFPRQTTFFTFPHWIVREGHIPQLRDCDVRLWLAVLHEAERMSNTVFVLTNADIGRLVGIGATSIRKARGKLTELRWVSCQRVRGNIYEYTLLDRAGQPLPRIKPKPPSNGQAGQPWRATARSSKTDDSGSLPPVGFAPPPAPPSVAQCISPALKWE